MALNPGRREGDADWHLLAVSFSLLFFFPRYLLLKVACDVMLSLEKASAPSPQGNPDPSHLYFQGEDLPSHLASALPPLAPQPPEAIALPGTAKEGVQPPPPGRAEGCRNHQGLGGSPAPPSIARGGGGFDVWEK